MADPFATAARRPALAAHASGAARASLTPAGPATRLSLRAKPEAVPALSAALGLDLPTQPKRAARQGERHALWLGPDEWLVIDESEAPLLQALDGAGVLHSAVDISHRNAAILVSGAGAAAVLNSGCPLNLSPAVFPIGACARTVLSKAEIVLYRTGETDFRVECWRSFAPYVLAVLAEAAAEV
ncbi:sarcosine oxidase subunit gamma [Xaviernesmea oryzae]|uniref:Sarcosine oxidase subunit gamma n=1 Tax=Xaviernesmea oryzae TaxID=464029 RepID=A0A1Q9AZ93_9HYPH|nr:sarcosine oxidase subunit gamma [Xaviernesmea oryzae]OLP61015.1 sarcosine oxidase subunit gamma [Xaviernesmea oryzae]SEL17239.1 sarcosine oxidase subunit gamma [Xaviernesmea oryzae]